MWLAVLMPASASMSVLVVFMLMPVLPVFLPAMLMIRPALRPERPRHRRRDRVAQGVVPLTATEFFPDLIEDDGGLAHGVLNT